MPARFSQSDLRRLEFAALNASPLPADVARPLANAIAAYLADPRGRGLDYHLGLPPRPSVAGPAAVALRDELYRRYAETLDGSADLRASRILDHVAGWRFDELEARDIGPAFEMFLLKFQTLEMPHVGQRQLRRIIG